MGTLLFIPWTLIHPALFQQIKMTVLGSVCTRSELKWMMPKMNAAAFIHLLSTFPSRKEVVIMVLKIPE
jgi:hypothetical protein